MDVCFSNDSLTCHLRTQFENGELPLPLQKECFDARCGNHAESQVPNLVLVSVDIVPWW